MAKDADLLIRQHYSKIGKKGGATNKRKGKAYFQWVRSHSKRNPVKKKNGETYEVSILREVQDGMDEEN